MNWKDLDDLEPPREKRIRFLHTKSVTDGWMQFVDRDGTPSLMQPGETLEDVLPEPHKCEKPGCILCESKPVHRVFVRALVRSTPHRMVPTPLKAPRHKKRSWMTHGYHKRIQKKWDAQAKGKTTMAPAMEARVLSLSRAAMNQIRRIYQSGRPGVVDPLPMARIRTSRVQVVPNPDDHTVTAHLRDDAFTLTGEHVTRQTFGFRHVVKDRV